MPRIDRITVDKIMDATDIVDVVGDFVSLKKRGANHWGLCPFHNDRSPSFSVNAAKGIFKCFSCGKAGSAVSFLMDLEGMSYVEALRWLAKKYNIEIQEKEMTSAERQAEAERESMYAVNDFAISHFEKNLTDTADGRDIGLAYFRERGISDAMIKKFHLGYAIDHSDTLYNAAIRAGFNEKFLVDTGLCIKTDTGRCYDRFKGRVIYPVHSLSGRVVAFGGRTLRKEKSLAKYVNSPESAIYSKSRELYGMYQARSAIARKKNCILVEGYMDVISLHQSGVENVVASSGTALTEGQVSIIKRFADKVTLIYDSDAAGIKAALRGINMFVAAGIALKLVLLPEGDDPDSFAQSHTSDEVDQYIAEHEQDLIGFKTDILMRDCGNDPHKRTEAINDILETIALIPDVIEQTLYIEECARKVGVNSATLAAQVKVIINRQRENEYKKRQQEQARQSIKDVVTSTSLNNTPPPASNSQETTEQTPPAEPQQPAVATSPGILLAEEEIIRYAIKYGTFYMCEVYTDDRPDEPIPMNVIDYIDNELRLDKVSFTNPLFAKAWSIAHELRHSDWPAKHKNKESELEEIRQQELEVGRESIRNTAFDMETIRKSEEKLVHQADENYASAIDEFDMSFIRDMFVRTDDRQLSDLAVRLCADTVVLSKMHPKINRREEICNKLPMAIYALKGALLKERINRLTASLAHASADDADNILKQIMELKESSMEFDRYNGEIVITPTLRR